MHQNSLAKWLLMILLQLVFRISSANSLFDFVNGLLTVYNQELMEIPQSATNVQTTSLC